MPRGVYSGLGAVGCSGLVEYVANVGVDGSDGDYDLFGDLPVGLAIANQAENINLSLGKTSRIPGGRRLSSSRYQVIHLSAQGWHPQVCRDLEGFFQQLLRPEVVPATLALKQNGRVTPAGPGIFGYVAVSAQNAKESSR